MYEPGCYKAIRLWHQRSGSLEYYWRNLQNEAARENAPLDAIFRDYTTRKWITVSDLSENHPFRNLCR
jgi:hypothetical protein